MSFLKNLFGSNSQTDKSQEEVKEDAVDPAEVKKQHQFETLRDDGVRALRIGEFPYAQRCFTAALEIKDDEQTLRYLAEAYLSHQDSDKALPILEKLTRKYPEDLMLRLATARAAEQGQKWSEMDQAAQEAMRIDPDDASAYFYRAKALYEMKDYLQAIALLTTLLAKHDDVVQAWQLRAQTLYDMQQYAEAEKDTDHLIETDTATEDTYLLKGDIRLALEDAQGAIDNYLHIREMDPFHHEAVVRAGKAYVSTHQLDKALQLYDEAIDLQPDFAEAYKERGNVRMQLHDKEGAMDDLKKSLELAPEHAKEVDGEFTNIENRINEEYKMRNPYGF